MVESSSPNAVFWNSNALVDWLTALSIAAFSLIVLAYVGLIPLGHWAPDEYATLGEYSRDGWPALAQRLIEWSPRPFSELLLFVYAKLVDLYKAPLIEHVLGALWFVLGTCLLAGPMLLRGEAVSRQLRRQATALALGLLCLLLLAHPVGEMFYWPQAAIAYLPVVSGVSMTAWSFVLVGSSSKKTRYAISLALCIAALSAEVGAMFVALFCSLVFAWVLLVRSLQSVKVREAQELSFLIMPFVSALGVAVAIAFGRFESADEIFGDPNVAHHIVPALTESVKRYLLELLSISGTGLQPKHLLVGTVVKASFFIGAYGTMLPVVATQKASRYDRQLLALLGVACFGTVFLVLASAYYQFGSVCCERHGTFRQVLTFLGLFSFAAVLAGLRAAPEIGEQRNFATSKSLILLGVSVAIPALYSVRAVASDYKNFAVYRQVQRTNWESGLAAGKHLVFNTPPYGSVYGGVGFPDGTHTVADDNGWMIRSILTYFNKESVTFSNAGNGKTGK
jgi:hypothetical protein